MADEQTQQGQVTEAPNEQASDSQEQTDTESGQGTVGKSLGFSDEQLGVEETSTPESEESTGEEVAEADTDEQKGPEGQETDSPSPDQETDETTEVQEEEEELSPEDFLDDEDDADKSNVQKRIDELTTEKYKLRAELNDLREKVGATEDTDSDEKTYSTDELRRAMDKAAVDGDGQLMFEAANQLVNQRIQQERKELEMQQTKQQRERERQNEEWKSVKAAYGHLWNEDAPELFKGSRKQLNLNDPNSLLYGLTTKVYQKDPERYNKPGGQHLAVSDALQLIRKKKGFKGGHASTKQQKQLERKVKKLQQKNTTMGKTGAVKQEKAPTHKKARSKKSKLEEYVKERKAQKAAKTNF